MMQSPDAVASTRSSEEYKHEVAELTRENARLRKEADRLRAKLDTRTEVLDEINDKIGVVISKINHKKSHGQTLAQQFSLESSESGFSSDNSQVLLQLANQRTQMEQMQQMFSSLQVAMDDIRQEFHSASQLGSPMRSASPMHPGGYLLSPTDQSQGSSLSGQSERTVAHQLTVNTMSHHDQRLSQRDHEIANLRKQLQQRDMYLAKMRLMGHNGQVSFDEAQFSELKRAFAQQVGVIEGLRGQLRDAAAGATATKYDTLTASRTQHLHTQRDQLVAELEEKYQADVAELEEKYQADLAELGELQSKVLRAAREKQAEINLLRTKLDKATSENKFLKKELESLRLRQLQFIRQSNGSGNNSPNSDYGPPATSSGNGGGHLAVNLGNIPDIDENPVAYVTHLRQLMLNSENC